MPTNDNTTITRWPNTSSPLNTTFTLSLMIRCLKVAVPRTSLCRRSLRCMEHLWGQRRASLETFDSFETVFDDRLAAQMAKRYKLSQPAKTFVIPIRACQEFLLKSFDLYELTPKQLQAILAHADAALSVSNNIDDVPSTAYMRFVKAVCLAHLKEPAEAITTFTDFKRQVDQFNQQVHADMKALEKVKKDAIIKLLFFQSHISNISRLMLLPLGISTVSTVHLPFPISSKA